MPFLGNQPQQGFANSVVKDTFTPNGSTTAFTLSKSAGSATDIEVYVGNVRQEPIDAYTVSGTTLTMSEAVATGMNFYVLHVQGTVQSSIAPQSNSVGTGIIQNNAVSTAKIATNAVTTAKITNANITQAKLASGVSGTGPAFHAHPASAQSISADTATKVNLGTELFDTDGKFDTSTSRFTPTVAGIYSDHACVAYANANYSATYCIIQIRKNGNSHAGHTTSIGGHEARHGINVSAMIQLDADDYIEMYIYNGGTKTISHNSNETHFSAAMVRSV